MPLKIVILLIIAILLVLAALGFWQHDRLLETVWNYLVVNENPQTSDVIIILGSGLDRVKKGVSLYQQGYAPKIILSGDAFHVMERQAVSLGVPVNDLLVEVNSGTTFGNAYYSTEIMRAQGFQSAIVVTSPYHTRRSGIIFNQFLQDWQVTVCSSQYDASISTGWWRDRQARSDVITEYLKMIYLYLVEIPVQKITSFLINFNIQLQKTLY